MTDADEAAPGEDCTEDWHTDDTPPPCPTCGETEKDKADVLVRPSEEGLRLLQGGGGPLFSPGDPLEPAADFPPWLVDGPPKLAKAKWPRYPNRNDYAKSPSWLSKLGECALRHAEIYRRRNKEPMGTPAEIGNAVHEVLAWAATRRIKGLYKGLPHFASPGELLHLLEHQEYARRNPEIMAASRELIEGMGTVSFKGAVQAEALVEYWAGRLLLAGYVDLVRVEGDPSNPEEVEGIDYKTGGSVPSDEDMTLDAQACVYVIALKRRYPNARRVTFKLWNIPRNEWRIVPYSTRLEEGFHAWVRAAQHTYDLKDETPTTGAHCDHCHVRATCPAYKRLVTRAATKPVPADLATLSLEGQIQLYREMSVLHKLAERRKSDLAALIDAAIPENQKTYRVGRLTVTRQRDSYTSWDGAGETLRELAAATELELPVLIETLTKGIGAKKITAWAKGLPEDVRARVERVIERRSCKGYTGTHLVVRETKSKAAF